VTLPIPDRRRTLGAVKDAAGRFTALLRAVDDPRAPAIGVWDVSEVATHMSHITRVVKALVNGGRSPITNHLTMSEAWQREVSADPERNLMVLADRIDADIDAFIDAATDESWTELKHWHGDLKAPTYTLASILVNESELHGLDVATASSRPWRITPHHALLAIHGLLPVLPHFLNTDAVGDLAAVYRLDLRGETPIFLKVAGGELEIDTNAPGRVDCTIKADPVAYLMIGYGRTSQFKPILTGKVLALGRKPWLGLRFAKLFRSP
jgi:uncharacterized protein (TIGR03083 family)